MVLKVGILGGANIAKKISRAINMIPDTAQGAWRWQALRAARGFLGTDVEISGHLHACPWRHSRHRSPDLRHDPGVESQPPPPLAAVVVVGSRSVDKARDFIRETKLLHAQPVEGYDAVLDFPGLDAVYIPLPTRLHVEWVRKATGKGLHIVLEKPIALDDADTTAIVQAVTDAGVVFFDGTMWMHHPRTALLRSALAEVGGARSLWLQFTFQGSEEFFKSDVRVKREADALGCLGDLGWYCARAVLWAFAYEPPATVTANPGAVLNEEGVPIHMGATLLYADGRRGAFDTGFDTQFANTLEVAGTSGSVYLRDLVIPRRETEAGFVVTSRNGLVDGDTRVGTVEETRTVANDTPQEAMLWVRFAQEVQSCHDTGKPDRHWLRIAAMTQRVLDAVLRSAQNGGTPVEFEWNEGTF